LENTGLTFSIVDLDKLFIVFQKKMMKYYFYIYKHFYQYKTLNLFSVAFLYLVKDENLFFIIKYFFELINNMIFL